MVERNDRISPATDDREWEGYINGLVRAGNMKSHHQNGADVLNDIRAQIDEEIGRAQQQLTPALATTTAWHPIETAPRTSLSRLVWCPERQNIYIVSMSHAGEWVHFGGLGGALTEEPTHWMPIPEAPK